MKEKSFNLSNRSAPEKDDLTYRALSIGQDPAGAPSTFDEETRSVEVVGASEVPVRVFDWERWEVIDEVLLMSGAVMPESRQVILCDTHRRFDTSNVIGSYREMRVNGKELMGRAYFTSLPEGEGPLTKLREGHLTDFSIGYRVLESQWIPEGETAVIQGRTYKGPIKVSTRWAPRELSICPIGADELAKARAESNTITREENTMDEKLKQKLIGRGLDPNATEEEAWAFLDKLTDPGPEEERNDDMHDAVPDVPVDEKREEEEAPDPENAARTAVADERVRTAEIDAMCRRFDVSDELRRKLISDGTTIEDARRKVMDFIEKHQQEKPQETPGYLGPASVVADERDKFRGAAIDSILARTGIPLEKPALGHDDLMGYSLKELARMSLRLANQPHNGNPMEMVGRALTTSDFPYILADSARKSLFAGYEDAEETWRSWCGTGQVADFLTHSIVRASETDDLDEIPENSEYKYSDRTEGREQYAVVTYGKLFALTRQAIVNDDLGALSDIPRAHGEAAARKIGDVAYAILTANAAMGDSIALFHASHSNLGTAGAISETTAAEAIKLMKVQTDLRGKRRLNIRTQFFLAPAAIEGSSEIFFLSNQFTGSSAPSTRANPYAGSRFTRVYDARLDDDSTTAYYFAGPKGKTVNVYFLNGVQTPYLESQQGWTVDGIEWKVRIDAGAKAVDWRAMVKNAGA